MICGEINASVQQKILSQISELTASTKLSFTTDAWSDRCLSFISDVSCRK